MFPKPAGDENVLVVTLGDYLDIFHPSETQLHSLYESILSSAEPSGMESLGTEFRSYLSDEILRAGLDKVLVN